MKKINYEQLNEITCKHCNQAKPKSEYYKNKWSYCKVCWQVLDQEYKSKKETVKNIEKPVKTKKITEKTNKIPPVNIDFDQDLSFLVDIEKETEEKDEIDVKEYIKSLENIDNEPEKEVKVAESFTVIDSEGYTRHLSRKSDRNMHTQLLDFQLVGRYLVYKNSEIIAVGLGNDIKYKKCESEFKQNKITVKYLVEFTNNDVEEYTATEFENRFGSCVGSYVRKIIKPESELSWKYHISWIEAVKVCDKKFKKGKG